METQALLESAYIELDPVLDGFAGVLVELSQHDDEYVLTETAAGTGNQLLRFVSSDCRLTYELFRAQISEVSESTADA